MRSAIYKYPLADTTGVQVLTLPKGARPLCVQVQGGTPTVWALVRPDEPETWDLVLTTVPTGHAYETDPGTYLGTCLLEGGAFVVHVFWRW